MIRGWLQRPRKRRLPRRMAITGRRQAWVLEGLEERVMLSPTAYVVNSADSSSSGSGTSGTLPYIVTQIDSNSNTDGSDVTFDNTVFNTPQTITLNGALALTETAGPITITGTSKANVTVSGAGTFQVFTVASGVHANLANMSIVHGSASTGAGIQVIGGTLTISGVVMQYNYASGNGGAIAVTSAGNLKVSGSCSISSNTASDGGGGIYDTGDGAVTVSGSKLKLNLANNGGGIYMESGTLTIVGGTISLNKASAQGGGIFDSSAAVKISGGASFASNSATKAPDSGGAIYEYGDAVTISNSTFKKNSAEYGGGVFVFGGSLKISDSVFSKNTAVEGGASTPSSTWGPS